MIMMIDDAPITCYKHVDLALFFRVIDTIYQIKSI